MLDVDPCPVRILDDVKEQTGELRTLRPVGRPARQSFSRIRKVAVLVQVDGEPEVVVHASIAIFADVDGAFSVDGEVVSVPEAAADRKTGGQVRRLRRSEQFDL